MGSTDDRVTIFTVPVWAPRTTGLQFLPSQYGLHGRQGYNFYRPSMGSTDDRVTIFIVPVWAPRTTGLQFMICE